MIITHKPQKNIRETTCAYVFTDADGEVKVAEDFRIQYYAPTVKQMERESKARRK